VIVAEVDRLHWRIWNVSVARVTSGDLSNKST